MKTLHSPVAIATLQNKRERMDFIEALITVVCYGFIIAIPPTKRLLGKSAEYVSAYTHAYTKKGKQIRTLWSGCGTITACVAIPYIMSRSETQF